MAMEAHSIKRRGLSAEESRFVHRPNPEDVILAGEQESKEESHSGNGYFRGLLLQRSHDFQSSLNKDERLAIAWIVMAKVTDRGGRFLTLLDEGEDGLPLYVALEKSAVLEQIRFEFQKFSTTPMARKKPRPEDQDRSYQQLSQQQKVGGNTIAEKPFSSKNEEIELVQDEDSSTNSKATTKSPAREEPTDRNVVSTPDPSVTSQPGPAVTTPDQEETKIQEVVVSSSDRAAGSVVGERESNERRDHASATRMIVKQLRALHQEVAGLKKDRSKLFNEVLTLRDECGHLNRALMDNKKERAMMFRDMTHLRKLNQKLAEILRSRSPAGPPPDSFRQSAMLRSEFQQPASNDDDLTKDLAALKNRLKEQQRLTETLLVDSQKSPLIARDARDSIGQEGIDPALLLSLQGGRRSPSSKKRHFPSEMDLDRSYIPHLSELEHARQILKRRNKSAPWSA